MELSDLELVAQAMETTTITYRAAPARDVSSVQPQPGLGESRTNGLQPASPPVDTQSQSRTRPAVPNPNATIDGDSLVPIPAESGSDGDSDLLADIDLSPLSPSDLAMLQPLLSALRRPTTRGVPGAANADLNRNGDGPLGADEETETDEYEMAQILAQMDAAGQVADELEDRLDRFIELLGKQVGDAEGDEVEGDEVEVEEAGEEEAVEVGNGERPVEDRQRDK
ncbi:hypothetical protein EHS25_009515 [Saitozyma podzolica]|uniref:Uncharacterized protein n=1 Tax=Saitozyma podzolica TaxID=1890683 RepID=A0A427YJH8_9TREE|nr:hypothetical protein EHS25_009515 [Saitozyma podzolica]